MSPIAGHRLAGLGTAGLVWLADQLVKRAMIGPLRLPEVGVIDLLPVFDLRWAMNFGVSFSLLSATSAESRWLLVGLTGLIASGVLVWLLRERTWSDCVALGLVLGGALGNIHDRVTRGFVVDYADLHFGEVRPFQIFNLADAAISIGVLIILARSFLSRDKRADDGPHDAAAAHVPSES
ncbi:signal peptidase II [Novosphingobium piscinae]|uniref:Lipoprotein signal peptidase n=1 Tax=Novosphingobium piscinae TaxID=1507448 RepID=A0A7X1G0B9_9SPHN|nr:signal peptidase II [Novosphingobium piscinae]MBC2670285.1 signal peptidase II [Novosphingobium piscinae]